MYDVQIFCGGGITAEQSSENCLTLVVDAESHGYDQDGNFTTITHKERVRLYGLSNGLKDALIAAVKAPEAAG